MGLFRRLYRLTALVLWFVYIGIATIPGHVRGGWRGIRGLRGPTHLWGRGIARIINLRITIAGTTPDVESTLVVSNHTSYLDIVTHGAVLPLRYAPKRDIASWPVLGWYLGLSSPIWTDRGSRQASKKTMRSFVKTMKHGMNLIVYPEGTTTDGKSGLLPFKSTSFEAAITGNIPILPVITRYKNVPGKMTTAWYGDMTLFPHVWEMLARPVIEAELRFLDPIIPDGRPRKELASFVRETMQNAYAQTANTPAPARTAG